MYQDARLVLGKLLQQMCCIMALGFFLAGCTGQQESLTTLERLKKDGKIRIGFANEVPYAYWNTKTKELTGEAPTVARNVLEKMGIGEVEGVLVEFGALIPGLKAKRFDMIAAGMYITPERCKQIAFSEPTYCIGEAFLVKAGNPLKLHSYEDVKKHESARLGVVTGTVEVGYAQKIGIPNERLVRFQDMAGAAAGVQAGRADAFAGTSLTINELLGRLGDSGLQRAEPFQNPVIDGESVKGCGAFGFRKDDTAFREEFDRHLSTFIGTDAHISQVEGFGFGRTELPKGVTRSALCAE